jgi:hypothetical protein
LFTRMRHDPFVLPVDLPPPARMRGPWAAFTAVAAALGSDVAHATPLGWHYDDGGGNRVDLVRLGERAVLLGWDREGATYFRGAARYFDEVETDLLAGAPDWWAPPVFEREREFHWIGFVYGFDGGWTRAEYAVDDGFTRVAAPVTAARAAELIEEWCGDAVGDVAPEAVAAVVEAGAGVTEAQLGALLGGEGDPAAGVAAARRF